MSDDEKSQLKNNFLIAYFGGYPGHLNFNSLVLINQNLEPLKKPIPRYVRTYKGLWIFGHKGDKWKKKYWFCEENLIFYA